LEIPSPAFLGRGRVTLEQCLREFTKVESPPFILLLLSFSLDRSPLVPSIHLLLSFYQVERLEGGNSYLCSKCKCKREAEKSFTFRRAPRVLVLHLKRFSARLSGARRGSGDVCKKITTDVQFPESLDLSPYMWMGDGGKSDTDATEGDCSTFRLIGIINHHEQKLGSTVYRHYTAFSRAAGEADRDSRGASGARGDWTCFDDKRCIPVSTKDVMAAGGSAYVLLYQRTDQ
jgi:ubiquitin C-terminal hydrolase